MIIALLVLIFFAIIFPGFFRLLFMGLGALIVLSQINKSIPIDQVLPVIAVVVALSLAVRAYTRVATWYRRKPEPMKTAYDLPWSTPRLNPKDPQFAEKYVANNRVQFEHAAQRAIRIGSPGYVWHTVGDSDICRVCQSHEGKFYRWGSPPACGHPGTHALCPQGYCRCWAEPVIPD